MARMSTTFLIAFFVLALLLAAVSVPGMAQATRECKKIGEMCGGFAGFQCCEGLTCKLEGSFPDAAGDCVRAY